MHAEAHARQPEIGDNLTMTPLGVWLTITIVITVGLFLGIVLSWIDPPAWATPRRLALVLSFVVVADIVITYMQQAAPVVPSVGIQESSAAASTAGLVPLGDIDAPQALRTILSITGENSGHSLLVESSLNGASRRTLGAGPFGGPFAVIGPHELIVSAVSDGSPHASGIAVVSLSGRILRILTSPAADMTDSDPTVTSQGEVFFLRTKTVWTGNSGEPTKVELMKVPASGKSPPIRVPTSVPLSLSSSISVDTTGNLLAAICQPGDSGGTAEACVFALPSGRRLFMTNFDGSSPITDIALSPDGKYLAYGDGAANAYGTIQIYVEDLATGSAIMVSRLPGNSQQPSWVRGSSTPCLVFSNSQTSGDVVYLSCLSAHPGTTRVAVGDYPEWLGTTLEAAPPSPQAIDWRALWNRWRPAILLIGMFTLGLLIGLFGGWFKRPAWATRPRIAGIIVALGALQVSGAVLVPNLVAQPSGGLTTVGQLDPTQAGSLLVGEDSTTGTGQMFGIRLNGTNKESLQFYPGGNAFIPVDNEANAFIFNYGGPTDANIELVGSTGNVIRVLANPPAGKTDSSPALATNSQRVYFVQSSVVPDGPNAYTTINPVVMSTSLMGGPAKRVQLKPAPAAGPISLNATGTELAATCPHGHYLQACVYELPGGTAHYVSSAPFGVGDLALSPHGRYLAYSTLTSLYVYNFQTGKTITIGSLPGWNEEANWLQDGSHPCLLFANLQTGGDTIYLACLRPDLAWAPVTEGEYPAWLGP